LGPYFFGYEVASTTEGGSQNGRSRFGRRRRPQGERHGWRESIPPITTKQRNAPSWGVFCLALALRAPRMAAINSARRVSREAANQFHRILRVSIARPGVSYPIPLRPRVIRITPDFFAACRPRATLNARDNCWRFTDSGLRLYPPDERRVDDR